MNDKSETGKQKGGELDKRLNGWSDIAGHLQVGVRTARRWEAERGLPVRRDVAGTVYGFSAELDQWRSGTSGEVLRGEPVSNGQVEGPSSSNQLPLRETIGIAIPAVVLAIVCAATWVGAYGIGVILLLVGAIPVFIYSARSGGDLGTSVATAVFALAAMAYIPSAATLPSVIADVVNMNTLRPAPLYAFVTGLKFLPIVAVVLCYCVILRTPDTVGFARHRALGAGYVILSVGLLLLTILSLVLASGDYQIVRAKLPGYEILLVGYTAIVSVNVAVGIVAYMCFRGEVVTRQRHVSAACGAGYLAILTAGILIDREYNRINLYDLDQRRTVVFAAANPEAISAFQHQIPEHLKDQVGPDLAAVLRDPSFGEALKSKPFYRQNFDEPFQIWQKAVIYGYRPGPGVKQNRNAFVRIRFPIEIATALRFHPR